MLTATEPGRRNRRTVDGVFLLAAAIVIGLTAVVASSTPDVDADVARALTTLFGWANGIWRVAFVALLVLALVVVVDVLVRRRWSLARDLLVALCRWRRRAWSSGEWSSRTGSRSKATSCRSGAIPSSVSRQRQRSSSSPARSSSAGFACSRCGSLLSRRWALSCSVPHSRLRRWADSPSAWRPARSCGWLSAPRPGFRRRRRSAPRWPRSGSKSATSRRASGSGLVRRVRRPRSRRQPLKVRVLGRDSQDTQRLARRWRLMAYRDPPRSAPIGRLDQVEHEALAIFMADQAGVRVPEVVLAAPDADGNALLVTRQPDVEPLELSRADQVSDETARRPLEAGGSASQGGHLPWQAQCEQRARHRRAARCSSTCRPRPWPLPNRRSTSTRPSWPSPAPSSSGRSAPSATPSTPAGETTSCASCPTCSARR